jgi:hypothetical protein
MKKRIRHGDPKPPQAFWLGDQLFRIGTDNPFLVPLAQANVLQDAILLGGLFDRRAIEKRSGNPDACRTLRALSKSDSVLAPYVHCPQKKGQGGYRVDIVDGRKAKEQ